MKNTEKLIAAFEKQIEKNKPAIDFIPNPLTTEIYHNGKYYHVAS